jgi:hypothetical protein
MAQPPPQQPPQAFAHRAMQPIRNPTYLYNDDDSFKATAQPMNVLERPPRDPGKGAADPRLTAAGSLPPVKGLTPIVPFATQNAYNVWALYPQ